MGNHFPHSRVGLPKIISSQTFLDTVTLDQDGCRDIILNELEPNQGLCLFRVSGYECHSLETSLTNSQIVQTKSKKWLIKKGMMALDDRDRWMLYQTRCHQVMRYCPPIMAFTQSQCRSPFIRALINCLGVNRNTKRVVCHRHFKYSGGQEIMDIVTNQFASRLHLLMTNVHGKGT